MIRFRTRPTRGIARIDQREKRTHGFFVRLHRKGITRNSFFADQSCGGKRRALRAARKYFQVLEKKYRPMTQQRWAELIRRKGKFRHHRRATGRHQAARQAAAGLLAGQLESATVCDGAEVFFRAQVRQRKARALAILARRIGSKPCKAESAPFAFQFSTTNAHGSTVTSVVSV